MTQAKQVIRRKFVIEDRSFKALEKQGIPPHLWNEIRACPTFGTTFKVEEKPLTPPPPKKDESKESESPKTPTIEISPEFLKKMWDDARDDYLAYFDWLESRPSFWEDEITKNEFRRSYYHKKKAWSPTDEREVIKIDKRLKYCQMRLEKILKNQPIIEDDDELVYIDDNASISGISLEGEDEPVAISN